jgi:hypothetical protein
MEETKAADCLDKSNGIVEQNHWICFLKTTALFVGTDKMMSIRQRKATKPKKQILVTI